MNASERSLTRQSQLQAGVGPRTPLKAKGLTGFALEGVESISHLLGEAFKTVCPIVPARSKEVIVMERRHPFAGMESEFRLVTSRPGQWWLGKRPFGFDKAHRVDVVSEQRTEHQVRVQPQIGAEEVPIKPVGLTYHVVDPVRLIRDFRGSDDYQRGMVGYGIERAIRKAFENPVLFEQAQQGLYNEAAVAEEVERLLGAGLPQIAGVQLRNIIFESTPPESVQQINAARMERAEASFRGEADGRRSAAYAEQIAGLQPDVVKRAVQLGQAKALSDGRVNLTMINLGGAEGLIPGLGQLLGGDGPKMESPPPEPQFHETAKPAKP